MPQFTLIPHPDFSPGAIDRVEVIAVRQIADQIDCRFLVYGDMGDLVLEDAEHPSDRFRRDELWRSTCFESFVRPANGVRYFETNLSPAGHWAAYEFTDYRQDMRDAAATHCWFKSDRRRSDRYSLSGAFNFAGLSDRVAWHVNLTAVIESVDGTKSYWALAHAPGPPDFHNRDCFIATLPAPAAL